MQDDKLVLDNFQSDTDFLKVVNKLSYLHLPENHYFKITDITDETISYVDMLHPQIEYTKDLDHTLVILYLMSGPKAYKFEEIKHRNTIGDVFINVKNIKTSRQGILDHEPFLVLTESRWESPYYDKLMEEQANDNDYRRVNFDNVIYPYQDRVQAEIKEPMVKTDTDEYYEVHTRYDDLYSDLTMTTPQGLLYFELNPLGDIDFRKRTITVRGLTCKYEDETYNPYNTRFLDAMYQLHKQCGNIPFHVHLKFDEYLNEDFEIR